MGNGFTGPPAVDFYSMLSGLGDTIAKNRDAAAKQAAFAAATTPGPDGKIDYGRAMLGLAQADPQAAALFSAAQNHQDTLKQQAIESARNASNDTFNHGIASANLKIAQANLANNSEGPEEVAQQRAAAAATYGLQPGTPEHKLYTLTGKLPDTYTEGPTAAKYSTQPIYAQRDGKPVLIQAGPRGEAIETKLPEGVSLSGQSQDSLTSLATRYRKGETAVGTGPQFRGPQGRVNYNALMDEVERQDKAEGTTPTDITQNEITLQGDKARERASGTMEGRMAPASIEAQGAFKIAQNSLDNLWRTNNVPLNRLLQMGEAATSNPELKAAKVAANTAVMTYSRAIAPTGVGTVDAQQHAREILDTADGPKATEAAFAQLAREVDMAHASPGIARQYFAAARKARMEGKPAPEIPTYQPAQPAASAPPPEAINALKQDPRRAADFDAYYGAGSARAVLSGGR